MVSHTCWWCHSILRFIWSTVYITNRLSEFTIRVFLLLLLLLVFFLFDGGGVFTKQTTPERDHPKNIYTCVWKAEFLFGHWVIKRSIIIRENPTIIVTKMKFKTQRR
ncbi:hypothetical protein GLYMA_14G057650v4 [Glycine max]|nr:hypothetical protein GLYMA_14G057650v4 [Glycine max]